MQKTLGRELGIYLSSFYLEKKGEKAFRRGLEKKVMDRNIEME